MCSFRLHQQNPTLPLPSSPVPPPYPPPSLPPFLPLNILNPDVFAAAISSSHFRHCRFAAAWVCKLFFFNGILKTACIFGFWRVQQICCRTDRVMIALDLFYLLGHYEHLSWARQQILEFPINNSIITFQHKRRKRGSRSHLLWTLISNPWENLSIIMKDSDHSPVKSSLYTGLIWTQQK